MKTYSKPKQFDNNIVVIGAGSGGLISAYIAAVVKAKVTLIEKHQMGGDCLNTGCVPSKALIKSASIAHYFRNANHYGIDAVEPKVNFAEVMERIQTIIKKIEPHDSVERFTGLGVNVIQGKATIRSPWEVEVNGNIITTKNIIIASGASPFIPPIEGLEQITPLTSENLWEIRELPKRLICLGGGPIGSELTQAFARLGSEVTQIERNSRLMPREDEDVSTFIEKKFIAEGVNVLTNHSANKVEVVDGEKILHCEFEGKTVKLPFDELIIAVGRKANVTGFGLEELGVELNANHTVQTNPFLATNYPNIFAVGDVTGPYQFTHTASHMAWYAAVNALFGKFKKFKIDYSVVPWATFTDPEVAKVGLNETEAKQQNIPYEVTLFELDDLDRNIADGAEEGWIKVLTEPNKDKILGVSMVGIHAGDLIHEYIIAMRQGIGLNKILGTIHIYPTLSEANKMVAGKWKQNHKPSEKVMQWLAKFHNWMRK
jgi:pyruvate/2-oxoglutarate dehydrogenase complex dihydrolipoamide dehydrogenase (E3) component